MRVKNILLISILILFTAEFSFANSDVTVSIAIITDKSPSLEKSALVPLLEVELSQKKGIQLLERAAIDKIMEEQKLSAAGLLDRNTAIQVGKLLRADAFIILSLENQSEESGDLIRVRFAETAHGLRLQDYFEQLDSENPKESVENIARELESALKKISRTDEKLIPVGIVDIHRVELGEKYKMLERTLPTMLSVRLSLEPQIIMLEREDLKVLLDEKLRTEGQDTEFWNSAILIDGYIQPHNGQLELHLNLKQAEGSLTKSLIVPVEPNEPVGVIDKAVTEIIQDLQDSPPKGKWNPKLEAEQFYKQGQMLEAHSRYEEALNLFETAHTLQPDNVYYTDALFARIFEIRNKIEATIRRNESGKLKYKEPGTCSYSDIEIAELVSILINQIHIGYEEGVLSTIDIYEKFSMHLGINLMRGGYFLHAASISTEQVRQINRENRKNWIEISRNALQQDIIKKSDPIMNNVYIASLAWISSDDPKEMIENIKKAYVEFIMPPELGGRITSELLREAICRRLLTNIDTGGQFDQTHLKSTNSVGQFVRFWQQYLEELTEIDDPILKISAYYCLARTSFYEKSAKHELEYYFKAIEEVKKELKKNDNIIPLYIKPVVKELYQNPPIFIFSHSWESDKQNWDKIIKIWEEILDHFIKNNDVNTLVAIDPGRKPFGGIHFESKNFENETIKRFYDILEQIEDVLKNKSQNNIQILSSLNKIKDFQVNLENQFSELVVAHNPIKLKVKMLLKENDWFSTNKNTHKFIPDKIKIKLHEKMLWLFTDTEPDNNIRSNANRQKRIILVDVAGIDLENCELRSLYQKKFHLPQVLIGLV